MKLGLHEYGMRIADLLCDEVRNPHSAIRTYCGHRMPSGSTLVTWNCGIGCVVAPTTFVPPVGRVTPLDCAPAVAATFGDGRSIPVTCTL